ncbi:MAG TPA: hypothetical protein VFA59_17965 [Vicinamibacterales bacterium]|nr:hypothetical protein [Vicinamibacterales bacterium]
MRVANLERAVALQQLLERPSGLPTWRRVLQRLFPSVFTYRMPRCGHRPTQPGQRDRLAVVWLPAVDVWTAERIASSVGALNGWKPAERVRRVARFGR